MAEERFARLKEALPFLVSPTSSRRDNKTKLDVIIGLDPHKRSNTIAVMTNTEELLARHRFDNSDQGIENMLEAVREHPDRV